MHNRAQTINVLRARIAEIVRRPALGPPPTPASPRFLETPAGIVQEVFADRRRDAGAGLGFALAQATRLVTPARPALVHIELIREAQELGLPYSPGLAAAGIDPETLLLVRVATIGDLLWAAEEALGCPAVAAVLAEVAGTPKELDFTASRRLALRAAASGVSLFLLRFGEGREASAASLRWHVLPVMSTPPPFDARAPGRPRWRVRLEKGVFEGRQNGEWLVEGCNDEPGKIRDAGRGNGADEHRRNPALPRSQPAALGNRLSRSA